MSLPNAKYLPLAGLLGSVWISLAPAAQLDFPEGDFSDWSTVTILGPAAGQTSSRQAAGGNPDAFLSVTTGTNSQTFTGHFRPSFVYDPAGGAINFIRASLDYRNIASFGQGQGVATLLLKQAGGYFQSGQFVTGSADFAWQNRAPVDFVSASFSLLAGAGTLDFSTAGAPIAIGFSTRNEGGFGINVGYDNFLAVVDTTPVPVPAALLLFLSAVIPLGRAGRRPIGNHGAA